METPEPDSALLVGICGPSGAGKSCFAHALAGRYPRGFAAVLEADHYYKEVTHLSLQERTEVNYDHPDAMDQDLLVAHLVALKEGKSIACPRWDYAVHNRSDVTVRLEPAPLVVVEGLLVLALRAVRALLDLSVYLDTPLDICLLRIVERDVAERGGSISSVLRRYQETVRPMIFRFIEPSRQHANLLLGYEEQPGSGVQRVEAAIRSLRQDDQPP